MFGGGGGEEYVFDTAGDRKSGLARFIEQQSSILFIDLTILASPGRQNPRIDYTKAFQPIRNVFPLAPIIVLSPQNNIRELVRAVKEGANDYLISPIDPEEVRLVMDNVWKAVRTNSELEYLRGQFWKDESLTMVRTQSTAMQKVIDPIRSAAPTLTTILLTGETGTGKGVMARLIHRHSSRSHNQFISVHCGGGGRGPRFGPFPPRYCSRPRPGGALCAANFRMLHELHLVSRSSR